MAFLRAASYLDPQPELSGRGLRLRLPSMNDYEEWVRLREQSRAFLSPWEPVWQQDDLTRSAFRQRVKRYGRDLRSDTGYAYFVFSGQSGRLVGGLTLSNVRRGVAQTASLGYWIGAQYARRGYMSAAVAVVVGYAFDQLRLHRIEAACLPTNEPSIRLLRRCGFAEEGYARRYLKIAGSWQDHLLFAILENDPRP
jgi:ribosomal-protein-alanine N-acetyltransferase